MSNLVEHWSVNDVAAWLKEIGLEKHSDLFRKHEINGEILLTMKENDLSSPPLNVREFGTVRKFSLRLEQLKLLQNKPSVTVENVTIKVEKVTKVEPAVYRSDLEGTVLLNNLSNIYLSIYTLLLLLSLSLLRGQHIV